MFSKSVRAKVFFFFNDFCICRCFLKNGKYREALGKWEAALTLMPDNAVLHEQKAQVLLEVADAWNALKAATSVSSFSIPLGLYTTFIFTNGVLVRYMAFC